MHSPAHNPKSDHPPSPATRPISTAIPPHIHAQCSPPACCPNGSKSAAESAASPKYPGLPATCRSASTAKIETRHTSFQNPPPTQSPLRSSPPSSPSESHIPPAPASSIPLPTQAHLPNRNPPSPQSTSHPPSPAPPPLPPAPTTPSTPSPT